jgi:heme exporter protein B
MCDRESLAIPHALGRSYKEGLMQAGHALKAFWCQVVKDLVCEFRLCRSWPGMLLLGLVLVLLLEMQVDLGTQAKQQVVSGLLWLDVFFAGTLVVDRSLAGEREEGCWTSLLLYPVSPTVVFFAKATVTVVALVVLECVLAPAFIVLSNIPLLQHPWCLVTVALLANLGYASVGVVISALTAQLSHRSSLLPLLLLPLMAPVLMSAGAATRFLVAAELDEQWWRWVQLLGCFAVLFTALGALVFEFVIED